MQINNFLLVNKGSGVTLLNKSYGLLEDVDDSPFLFSAAMVAIQDLMQDVKIGRVKNIRTDEYHIIGEASDRFIVFCIGIFESNTIIVNFMKKVCRSLEGWVDLDDRLFELSTTIVNIIEVMMDQFVTLWGNYQSSTGIFVDKQKLGFQSITPHFDQNIELVLTGYFTSLSKSLKYDPHSFCDILPTGGSIIGLMTEHVGARIIVYTYFEELDLKVIISNKQNFLNITLSFIQEYGEEIVQSESIRIELEEPWEKYNTDIRETMTLHEPDYDFLDNEEILNYLNGHLTDILDKFVRGKPIAILCNREFSSQVIDLLLYVTGTISASTQFDEDFPQRITCFNPDEIEAIKALNYEIFDLNQPNKISPDDQSYFCKAWRRAYNPDRSVKDILINLQVETMHIWDIAIGILIQHIFGQEPEIIFSSIPSEEYGLLFKEIINWVNPYVLQRIDFLKITGEKKNNW